MASRPKAAAPAVFELRSASMTLVVLVLKTTDMAAIERELTARFTDTPDMFNNDPVVVDVAQAEGDALGIDWSMLSALMSRFSMVAVAVRGGTPEQTAAALSAGLGEAPEAAPAARPLAAEPVTQPPLPLGEGRGRSGAFEPPAASPRSDLGLQAQVRTASEGAVTPPPPVVTEAEPPAAAEAPSPVATLIIDKPLRSGQQVYARGGDLVVLAAVNNGAEVIADGSIHVYAPLRGKAIAGAKGNAAARIFSTCMQPELISIAGTYRTTDQPLPGDVLGKPAQIRLDGERLVFEPLG